MCLSWFHTDCPEDSHIDYPVQFPKHWTFLSPLSRWYQEMALNQTSTVHGYAYMSHPLQDSTVLTGFQATAAKEINGPHFRALSTRNMKSLLLLIEQVSFLWQSGWLSFLLFLGNVLNNVVSWICWQVLVQGDCRNLPALLNDLRKV